MVCGLLQAKININSVADLEWSQIFISAMGDCWKEVLVDRNWGKIIFSDVVYTKKFSLQQQYQVFESETDEGFSDM